ncbi:RluA family pseudouridine synthase [Sutcliffiella cohnii]
MFTLHFIVKKQDEGKLLREFLREKHISKSALADIKFAGGSILVNGNRVTVRYVLRIGDDIEVTFPEEISSEGLKAEQLPLDIVYEDDYVLVLNKAPYMNSIPSREHPTGSVANALLYYYKKNGLHSAVHIVTRLDRDTSGLMLIAKNRYIHHLFSLQQKDHFIQRSYIAIVHGRLKKRNGIINEPIGRKETSIIEREVRQDGQHAITHYEVMEEYSQSSLLKLKLETGRTHQIRVHLSYVGNPLLGDDLYGGKRDLIKRQALHSCELTFFHPVLEQELHFQSKLPADMQQLLNMEE